MKLLFINNDKGWGGGQEYLKDLATELLKCGCEVHLGVRAGSPSERLFREFGLPVHGMPNKGINHFKAVWKLASIIRRERFDIISINREHDIFPTVIAALMVFPRSQRSKLLMTYHIGLARKQYFLGFMDGIICVSDHVRSTLLRLQPGLLEKTHIIHNGIKLTTFPCADKFSLSRKRRFFKGEEFPIIGMVGAFWKNQGELVECIPFLQQEFPSLKVAFVGDDRDKELYPPLMEKIRGMGLEDKVIFSGKIPRDRLEDMYFDLDLSVTTHRNEGFGLVHLESLAAGTPVVAYSEGGQVDILAGEEVGKLVDGGKREFAAAVADLLRDHDKRLSMGRKGFDFVKKRFTVDVMAENYRSYFNDLLY